MKEVHYFECVVCGKRFPPKQREDCWLHETRECLKLRVYGSGLDIRREDTSRCIARVPDDGGYYFFQCKRRRGHGEDGLYCKTHAKRHPAKEQP